MVINCYPFSLALSCSCSSFMSGMEFVMISFYSSSSRVSSPPLCCAVTSCFSVRLSLLHLILFSPVSFDDAPRGNDERSSYMRCQLHTQTYTDIREFINSLPASISMRALCERVGIKFDWDRNRRRGRSMREDGKPKKKKNGTAKTQIR